MEPTKEVPFAGGIAASSAQPRWDLLPRRALLRLIARTELGIERKTLCKVCGVSKSDVNLLGGFSARCHYNAEHAWECKAWNARSANQACLTDKEFVISRVVHTINHAYALLAKLIDDRLLLRSNDEDDDAAAIMWNGMFLCEATDALTAFNFCTAIATDGTRCGLGKGHPGLHTGNGKTFIDYAT